MARSETLVDLFRYLDYRSFLRDWFAAAKRRNRRFSHRALARLAGFRSPAFLKLVMDEQRNLTEASLAKCMRGLRLNKQEQAFFHDLVHYTQARTPGDKDHYYRRLLRSRKYNDLRPVARRQYEFYADWWHAVVRELAVAPACDGTPEWIATRVDPPLTTAQAKKSLALLTRLGLLRRTVDDRWEQTETLLTTGAEVVSHVIVNYHKGLLELARAALERLPAAQRDISALTLGIPAARLPQLKERIRAFRREILELVADDTRPETVVQLDIQLFPVTRGETT